jgi:uncharacterized protein YfcZ (UPF0381/DUF406 family)
MGMKVVYLSDAGIPYEQVQEHFANVAEWAKHQCSSFVDYHVQDVSDVSYHYDHVAEFKFQDSKDAIWFQLKWKSD